MEGSEAIDVVVRRRDDRAGGAVAVLELARRDGTPLPDWTAGAHLDLTIAGDLIRPYSLCGVPGETRSYRLGILDDPASRGGSRAVHATFTEGLETQISAPRNHFPLDKTAKHSVLAGGGIGITPMLAMAHALKAAGQAFELHYCVRTRESAAFLEELTTAFPDETHLHCDDGSPDQRFAPDGILTAAGPETHLYVCGPGGFMDWVIDRAKAAGLDKDRIHFEYFNAKVDTHGAAFEVVAAQSGVTVTVGPDETILDALGKAGIKIPKSCQQGVCGTCLCDVLEGEPDHKDKFLTEDEREDNDQIITCCSRAKSTRLVLDV
ncbi:MAG: PDR/VanB family oxidoreductase [Rhodospirillum sp.]|nr:PDR/VanB family oxidoreductase [Rhodospirillum sp.]MCF8491053.1 PDR/VanB family oxidoreductase [Rhodospirillum sp.]MCF8500376.1 PDR/VanB family oxidoreductase [Rhodospirillum sp.]